MYKDTIGNSIQGLTCENTFITFPFSPFTKACSSLFPIVKAV